MELVLSYSVLRDEYVVFFTIYYAVFIPFLPFFVYFFAIHGTKSGIILQREVEELSSPRETTNHN